MLKWLGYAILALGGLAGYFGVQIWVLLVLAFVSTLIFSTARRQLWQTTPQAPDQSAFLDGMWLFASQILVMFFLYMLGVFAHTAGGELFGMWIGGQR